MTTETTSPLIWVLADDRAGNRAQCIGVAEKLGLPFEIKEIRYNFAAALPNGLLGASFLSLHNVTSSVLEEPPFPDMVIAAGRRAAPIARAIKRLNPECRLVHLMWPDVVSADFNLIALPEHDERQKTDAIITTTLAPHWLTRPLLAAEKDKWQDKFSALPSPRIALLVGGSSKNATFSDADFKQLTEQACALAGTNGALLVTTSRRTGAAGEDAIRKQLAIPHHMYAYGDEGDNPYIAMLAHADAIVVTGDSISMISEAIFTGKPVFIYAGSGSSAKHQRLHQLLYDKKAAAPLAGGASLSFTPAPLPDAAEAIAAHIRKTLLTS